MRIPLIQPDDEAYAKSAMAAFYGDALVPAEKKDFLVDLSRCVGPYLAVKTRVGETRYLLDAASQITTLGLGFNPLPFFGAAYRFESWTNRADTEAARELRRAFDAFLTRQLGWRTVHTFACASGAEANEIALGECYRRRLRPEAGKVLAFEGSFHGRTMVALAATWNASKRMPFEWKDYTAEYCPFPESKTGEIRKACPPGWRETWAKADGPDFHAPEAGDDALLSEEVRSLTAVRGKLLGGRIFAVIVEAMQCEGGDRFATDRFFTGLLLMARSFGVAVVMDEVQTGFHLSEKFFWHRIFELRDAAGKPLLPDHVTCAKRSQVGLVLSREPVQLKESVCMASLTRGYAQGMMLEQNADRIPVLEGQARQGLRRLAEACDGRILNPRGRGMSFAFDLPDPESLNRLVARRFAHGLMFYPAGDRTARFRLNLSFMPEDVAALFRQLTALCREVLLDQPSPNEPVVIESPQRDPARWYRVHEAVLNPKLALARGERVVEAEALHRLILTFGSDENELKLVPVALGDLPRWREAVASLQVAAYEPARRTPLEKFERALRHPNTVALVLTVNEKLAGITFAGPLKLFPDERLVEDDPDFNDEDCLYVLDTTVHPDFQGRTYGLLLRYALHLTAMLRGRRKLNGRNRDRLARTMWEINLSAGAVEIRHGENDYPDDLPHRDVIYYTSSLAWPSPRDGARENLPAPVAIATRLPALVNKLTLANFVTPEFLADVKYLFGLLPEELRHGYTASGQSECADKIVKSVRYQGTAACRLFTFEGCYFGEASFIARSLSLADDPYFPVVRMPFPNAANTREILAQVADRLASGDIQSVWIEPVRQNGGAKAPRDFLAGLREVCRKAKTPLAYNETASLCGAYDGKHDFAACDPGIRPDLGMAHLGGQAGFVYTRKEYFVPTPLMMISTWDGDENSLRAAVDALRRGRS